MSSLEERIDMFHRELKDITGWYVKAIETINLQLQREGRLKGLDGNNAAYSPAHEELNRRLSILIDKYKDLPPDTKIDFKTLQELADD